MTFFGSSLTKSHSFSIRCTAASALIDRLAGLALACGGAEVDGLAEVAFVLACGAGAGVERLVGAELLAASGPVAG